MPSQNEQLLVLAAEYQRLYEALQDGADTNEELNALFADFKAHERDINIAFEQFVQMDRLIEAKMAEANTLGQRIKDMHNRWGNRRKSLHRYLLLLLQRTELRNVKTVAGTLFRRTAARLVVDDLNAIPDEYTSYKITPKEKEIKEALDAGKEIAGVHLEDQESVGIR